MQPITIKAAINPKIVATSISFFTTITLIALPTLNTTIIMMTNTMSIRHAVPHQL